MDMDSEHIVLSRMLPKTGQTAVILPFDDGDLQKGWWKGRTAATNRQRFVAKIISGERVVIDRATGLMWPKYGDADICAGGIALDWSVSVSYFDENEFAGFEDWRLPNIHELSSIIDFGRHNPAIDPIFEATQLADAYWSSTTYHPTPSINFTVDFWSGFASHTTKDKFLYIRPVRTL